MRESAIGQANNELQDKNQISYFLALRADAAAIKAWKRR